LTSYYLLIQLNISAKHYTILPTGIYNHRHATLWEERCVKEKKEKKKKKGRGARRDYSNARMPYRPMGETFEDDDLSSMCV